MTDLVQTAREGGVTRITLARPDKKNALTGAMYEAMMAAFREAEADEGVGAILVAGRAREPAARGGISTL